MMARTSVVLRIDDRVALIDILLVLFTCISWEDLPQQMGFGRHHLPDRGRR